MNERAIWLRAPVARSSLQELMFALPVGQIQRRFEPDARRDRFVHQRVQRGRADDLQHGRRFFRVGSDVPGLERFEIEDQSITRRRS